MDEVSMNHILDASTFSDSELPARNSAASAPQRLIRIPWEDYLRCLFLLLIVAAIGYLAWRPSLLRFSILLSLVSPSHGDSLIWKPAEGSTPFLPQAKKTPSPSEWRLAASHTASGLLARPEVEPFAVWRGGALSLPQWQRVSFNPWSWRDDSVSEQRRGKKRDELPPQPFAVPRLGEPRTEPEAASGDARKTEAPAPLVVPALPSRSAHSLAIAAPQDDSVLHAAIQIPSPGDGGLPLLKTPSPATRAEPKETIATIAESDASQAAAAPVTDAKPEIRQTSSAMALSGSAAADKETNAPSTPATGQETTDWKNREITGTVPGSYLTIYPKLRFIGLCVPGQGYIRKYHQAAVPRDLMHPKMASGDGRTPYGKYYITGRQRDGNGPRLLLSWPSLDDARRLNLSPEQTSEIERAWLRQGTPPQDTVAGGGLAITLVNNHEETTDGGFGLEGPQLEEIFTALPDGAWIFVQQ